MDTTRGDSTGAADALELHNAWVFPVVRPMYKVPLVADRAEGVWVTDTEGREYLDLFAGVLTTSIGHCHPAVLERVQEQAARLGHTSSLYLTASQGTFARKLAELAPGSLQKSLFTNSGSEAVETAVMLARIYTGRHEIIALRHAYSGRTVLCTGMTAHSSWRPLASATSGVTHAVSPYVYRSPLGPDATIEEHEDYFIRDLEETIDTASDGKPAALFAETIQGVGGYIVPTPGYFRRAAELIRDRGGLLIIDEVQTGFGRTGRRWFGIEHWGVDPDIMVAAKGIANGYPVGATIARPEIADAWTKTTFSTYGGNPVCMVAAEATLDVMVEEDVPTRSEERGRQLEEGLQELQQMHAWIGDVRGMGLMRAMELVKDPQGKAPAPQKASQLLEAARDEGLLLGIGGLHRHVIRFGPSMLITEDEMGEGLARLTRACARVDEGN